MNIEPNCTYLTDGGYVTEPQSKIFIGKDANGKALTTKGMVEVTKYHDYVTLDGDVYVERGAVHPVNHLTPNKAGEFRPVSWYVEECNCVGIFATQKNYDQWILSQKPTVPSPEHSVTVAEEKAFPDNVNIGDGYRKLLPEELITNTTEFRTADNDVWCRCNCGSEFRCSSFPGYVFREEIRESEANRSLPNPGEGYRFINQQVDKPEKNDEIRSMGGVWKKRSLEFIGTPFKCGETYRRKVVAAKDDIILPKNYKLLGPSEEIKVGITEFSYDLGSTWTVCDGIRGNTSRWPRYIFREKLDAGVSSSADSVVNTTKDWEPVPSIQKEEKIMSNVVKFATVKTVVMAIAMFAGKWTWRGVNYWALEPVKEVAMKVVRAVRYCMLGTAIAGGVYAYNDPAAASKLFWDCLPGVDIQFKAPEILKAEAETVLPS